MIEETGVVVTKEGDFVWVETQVKTTCGSCQANESCATSVVAKAFSSSPNHVQLKVPCDIQVGQYVKIGIDENALIQASWKVYILPLLLMIITASLFNWLFPAVHELIALLVSVLAALGGFWWTTANVKTPSNHNRYEPVFLGATVQQTVTAKHEIPVKKL